MRIDEFKRINLKVTKDNQLIYEGPAEELPEELKELETKEITIRPNLAEIIAEEKRVEKEF